MKYVDFKELNNRFKAAEKILSSESTGVEQFRGLKKLVAGFNPKLDKQLKKVEELIATVEKIHRKKVVELTVKHLPQDTPEQKKRRKALLLLLKRWKRLRTEVARVKKELQRESKTSQDNLSQVTEKGVRIGAKAKGLFGLLTVVAVVIAVGLNIAETKKREQTDSSKLNQGQEMIEVIRYRDWQIPVTELHDGIGRECLLDGQPQHHFHPSNQVSVITIEGEELSDPDPGGCGFGMVESFKVYQTVKNSG
jgi:hypothetical protein